MTGRATVRHQATRYDTARSQRPGWTSGASTRQALTIRPAKLLGVDQFVGSIEPGKDGDLVVWSADPLKADAWVDTTLVDGKVVYERSADKKLAELLRPPSASAPKPADGEKR